MKNKKIPYYLILAISCSLLLGSCKKWSESGSGSIRFINNEGGQNLGYDTTSGVKLLTVNGFAFKDLNRNGKLDVYEDWRKSAGERVMPVL